ncbi:MAG TPA: SDR family oxidoreductase [Kineosporiaceae bacterium]|nr:SDR family oxidoreductase [Kineosporiaceae bacterium]
MITVTGASGHLGRLVVEDLLRRGVEPGGIRAVARTPEKVADLAARGVEVRQGDYDQPDSLVAAFEGTRRLVLVSSSEIGQRVAQHRNAVEAAAKVGVELIAYTSILKADTSGMILAGEHLPTENLIRESGIPFTLLRNGWYLENYTENLAPALEFGTILGSAGTGLIAAAARADYAAAAAAVVTGSGHENRVYELGADRPFTMAQLAETVSAHTGRTVTYTDLPAQEYVKALVGAGVPEVFAGVLADSDAGIVRGELATTSTDLRELIGRPATTLDEAVAAALAA